jgi:hypothetical protein
MTSEWKTVFAVLCAGAAFALPMLSLFSAPVSPSNRAVRGALLKGLYWALLVISCAFYLGCSAETSQTAKPGRLGTVGFSDGGDAAPVDDGGLELPDAAPVDDGGLEAGCLRLRFKRGEVEAFGFDLSADDTTRVVAKLAIATLDRLRKKR